MPRNILTALLTASLAFATPAIATPKAAKPTAAKRQPENEWNEFRHSQNDSPMQIAQHIQTEDLIGVWGQGVTIDEGSMLNMTIMSQNGTGADLMVLTINNPKSSLRIRQQFTWQFNEKTQTFSQRITDFSTTRDNEPSKQDKSQIGKTSTAKARMLLWNGKPDMLELTDQASGEKQSYFKQNLNKLREILKP